MKKRVALLTMLLVMLCGTISAADYDIVVDGIYYRYIDHHIDDLSEKVLEVVGGEKKYEGDIVIPSIVKVNNVDYTVFSIDEAFKYCSSLTSVVVPNTVEIIKSYAFSQCSNLSSVVLGNKLRKIGDNAFFLCEKLSSINFPNSLIEIGSAAFWGCRSLPEVIFGDNIEKIGAHSFRECISLSSIVLPESVKEIEQDAFVGCTSLSFADIPSGIIGFEAFSGCTSLSTVELGKMVTSIEQWAFSGCSLKNISIPQSTKNIVSNAFIGNCLESIEVDRDNNVYDSRNGCNAIIESSTNSLIQGCKNTIIPNSIVSIKSWAFGGCKGLVTMKIPNSVISIGRGAFESCEDLTQIVIPNSVTTIDDGAFHYCLNLSSVVLPDNISSLGYQVFMNCQSLTSIKIPNSVEEIGSYTFQSCKSLNTITIGSSVKNIYASTFTGCPLRNIYSYCTIAPSIDDIFTSSVYKNATLYVPKGSIDSYKGSRFWKDFCNIVEMGSDPSENSEPYVVYNNGTLTFYCDNQRSSRQGVTYDLNEGSNPPEWQENKESITKAVFDASFTNARPTTTSYWFWDLSSLTKIEGMYYLNTSEVTDMYSMFFGCRSLTALDLSHFDTKNVTNMGQMFYGCNNLKSLNLSNFDTGNVTYMGFMFYLCYNLTSLDVSHFDTSKVTGMRMMFASCQNLTTLDISCFDVQSATDLSEMFAYCHGLTTLDVSKFNTENAETMGYMFKYCDNLTSLDLSSFSTRNAKDRNHETWTNYGIEGMLSGCNNLAKIAFGSGFASDDKLSCNSVFSGCDALSNVTYTGDIPTSINSTFFIGVGTANAPATLVVPEQYKANYQAKFSGNQFYSGYFTMSNGEASGLKDGDTFTVKTVEGVEMTFKVISAADKTCQLGDGTKACIDTSTSGSFTIPAEVNGFRVNSVASWALYGCYGLNEIVISEGVESLMDNSIEQCNGVTSFVLPASVTSLSNTFGGVSSCLKSIKVAEGNPVYDSRNNCNAIIETASNVLRDGCVNTVIPSTVTAIGDWAMCNKNLTSISIPSSVKSIGDGALRYNPFKTVTIPESIENVGFCAFEECWYLEKVTIASKKCRLEGAAFANCGMLKTVVSYLEIPEAVYRNIFYNSYDGATSEDILNDNVELYVPFGTKTIYENTNGWKNFKNIVEMNATVGDVTGDGEVTKEDITEVEAEIINPSEEYDPNKDVNHDGVVNVADIVEEVNIINSGEGTGSGYFWLGNYYPTSRNFPTLNGKEVEGIVTTYTSLDEAMAKASRTYFAGEWAVVMYPSSWGTKDDLVFLDSANMKYYVAKQKDLSDFPDYTYYETTIKIVDNTTITLSTESLAKAAGATLSSLLIK